MAVPELKSPELKLDPDKLYLEEVFTDRRIGTLRRLTPVTKHGKTDASRAIVYVGETQIMTPAGSIPIAFGSCAGRRAPRSSFRRVPWAAAARSNCRNGFLFEEAGLAGEPLHARVLVADLGEKLLRWGIVHQHSERP